MIHPIQKQLLELSQKYDLNEMGLRQIGRLIKVDHPQKVKFHLEKLGLLENGKKKRSNHKKKPNMLSNDKIASIPILGLANCGEATMIAENRVEGILPISKKFLGNRNDLSDIFAVKAVGSSMDKADVDGETINDGDYVIIDSGDKNIVSGDYVLSIIKGLANIKRFTEDQEHNQIVLESESSKFFPPIHIHSDDLDDYIVNGKVIKVIKQPRINDELHYDFFS